MLTGPNHVFDFVCQQTGRCCSSGWKVELSHYDQVNLVAKARGTPIEAAVAEHVIADPAAEGADDYQRTYHLAKSACGGCTFLDGNRCSIHAAIGPLALPDPCRNFPVIAVQTAWGVEVGYNLTCPHAIALTAKSPLTMERREDWERPLDPQQTRASFIPPPEGWRAFREARKRALDALAPAASDEAGLSDDALLDAVAASLEAVALASWDRSKIETFADALDVRARIEVCVDECAPFLSTWGAPLSGPPRWATLREGLEAAGTEGRRLVARYLQHTLHTCYFRTGLPAPHAYRLALAAWAAVVRLGPGLAEAYPKAPLRAAIVLVEMGLFGDLRSLAATPLPSA